MYTPLGQTPPGQTPPRQTPPPSRRPLQRMVRILLECILVFINYTDCSDPDPVPNAQRFPEHGPYERLSFVTYTCNTGYTLTGSASITCHSHGEWSSPSPTCSPTGKEFMMLHHPAVTSIISVEKRAYQ